MFRLLKMRLRIIIIPTVSLSLRSGQCSGPNKLFINGFSEDALQVFSRFVVKLSIGAIFLMNYRAKKKNFDAGGRFSKT